MEPRRLPVLTHTTDPAVLPPRYAAWMDALLGAPIPAETEATCSSCAMVLDDKNATSLPSTSFDPAVKCCTYLPELPNYLVGSILRDTDAPYPEGRDVLIRRIQAGIGVSPLGVLQTSYFKQMFTSTVSGFGHSHALRCPHYVDREGGRCGIWKHREAMCATWYCKHVRGSTSRLFWNRLHQLLLSTERALGRWCALEAGLTAESLRTLFPIYSPRDAPEVVDANELDGGTNPIRYARVWGEWQGREQEYFLQCAERVDALEWQDVLRIGGSELAVSARILKATHEGLLKSELPAYVRPGQFQVLGMTREVVRVVTYSPLDPRDLPRALVDVLPLFTGVPTAQALAHIQNELGLPVTEDDVQKLVDFQLLEADEPPAQRTESSS